MKNQIERLKFFIARLCLKRLIEKPIKHQPLKTVVIQPHHIYYDMAQDYFKVGNVHAGLFWLAMSDEATC